MALVEVNTVTTTAWRRAGSVFLLREGKEVILDILGKLLVVLSFCSSIVHC
jgi:hypothetical protein